MRFFLKAFVYLLLVVGALAGAMYVGTFMLDDPGFVIISYRGKAVRTSFAIFVIALVLLLLAGYFLLRLVAGTLGSRRAVGRWMDANRKTRARKSLWRGLVDLAAGDWEKAERALASHAADSDMKLLHYLGAARAAQAQSAIERRDAYLRLAHEVEPDARAAVALTRAEMQLGQGQIEQARATLSDLLEHEPGNRRALRMLYEILRQTGQWPDLMALLPRLRRKRVIEEAELEAVEKLAYRGLLEAPDSDASDLWGRIPRRYRNDPQFLGSYVEGLVGEGREAEAETLLRKAVNRSFDAGLVGRYGALETADPGAQLRVAEGWLKGHEDEPALMVALGRLCTRQELWGKARGYFEKAVEQEPSSEVYALLVDSLNQLGETEAAGECAQRALVSLTDAGGSAPRDAED